MRAACVAISRFKFVMRGISRDFQSLGRPPIGKKAATLYALRLPDEIVRDVKAYTKANGLKSQSAAIRQMIEVVLEGWKSGT